MKKLIAWFKKMIFNKRCRDIFKAILKAEKGNRDCRQKARRIKRAFWKEVHKLAA